MALRSQEEISLATAFTRTLRNVLALTSSEDRRAWPSVEDVVAHTPADATVPASLFRLLQFRILPELLGESAGPALYVAGKRFSASLGLRSIQALKEWFRDMDLGELEVELDQERVLVKLSQCASCRLLPPTGTAICDLERGIVDGVLEGILGTEVVSKETLCWSLGDTVCQFEGYSGPHGYAYQENGFHPEAQKRLLVQLADQSEVALDNLRLINERREHETRDPLTGLRQLPPAARARRVRARPRRAVRAQRGRRHARPRRLPCREREPWGERAATRSCVTGPPPSRRSCAAATWCAATAATSSSSCCPRPRSSRWTRCWRACSAPPGSSPPRSAGSTISLTASAGVAIFPQDGTTHRGPRRQGHDHHVRGPRRGQRPRRLLLAARRAAERARRGRPRRDPRRGVAAPRPRARGPSLPRPAQAARRRHRARDQGGAAARARAVGGAARRGPASAGRVAEDARGGGPRRRGPRRWRRRRSPPGCSAGSSAAAWAS